MPVSTHKKRQRVKFPLDLSVGKNKTYKLKRAIDRPTETGNFCLSNLEYSPVNLGIFEAQHQTNCNRIVFNAILSKGGLSSDILKSAKIRSVEHVKIKR